VVYKSISIFEAANPGVVKAQMVANGTRTEFNLLKLENQVFLKLPKK